LAIPQQMKHQFLLSLLEMVFLQLMKNRLNQFLLKKSKNFSPKSKSANWQPSQEVKEKKAIFGFSISLFFHFSK